MHNPAHPGEVLKEMWLEPLGLTLTQAAMRLGVTRKTISKIFNAHEAITPEMALRLEIAFGTSAQVWMNMQTAYDLAAIIAAENSAWLAVTYCIKQFLEGMGFTIRARG